METSLTDPVGIFLVSSGTRGDRLLFRYPYDPPSSEELLQESINPYAVKVLTTNEDFDVTRNVLKDQNTDAIRGPLSGYPDVVLANLLCIRTNLCRRKFQLKVNDIVFIGYPMQLVPTNVITPSSTYSTPKREPTASGSFNIVFAIKGGCNDYVLNAYQEFTKQIGIAIIHEERRCGYFTQQKQMMWEIQDDNNTSPEDNNIAIEAFQMIAQRCSLAKQLIQIYNDLYDVGVVRLYINKWIPVNFSLLPKVQAVDASGRNCDVSLKHESVRKCIDALRPFHTMLLLEDESCVLESLPVDASPSLIRLIKLANPLKNIYNLALDADLSVEQVLQIVAHLVYWAKAAIIYPVCDSNIYLVSPHCNTYVKSALAVQFGAEFPGLNLVKVLAQFSVCSSLRDHVDVLCHRYSQMVTIPVIIWLLRHRFLYQLHTYVTVLPSGESTESFDRVAAAINSTAESVCSNDLIPSSADSLESVASLNGYVEPPGIDQLQWQHSSELQSLTHLSDAFGTVPASCSVDDLKMFARLHRYFNGEHHLEEISFYESIQRSQLIALLEKFDSFLVVCHHEEPEISYWVHGDCV